MLPPAESTASSPGKGKGKGKGKTATKPSLKRARDGLAAELASLDVATGPSPLSARAELREKLRAKLAALRADRPERGEPPQKRARTESRERRDSTRSKDGSHKGRASRGTSADPEKRKEKPKAERPEKEAEAAKPDLEFATFSYQDRTPIPTYLATPRGSKHQKLIAAKEKRAKIAAARGTEEGAALAEEAAWDTMMKRARGEKVKDDIARIKKKLQADSRKKKKSSETWKEREKKVKVSQEKAQAKRSRNIKERADKKRDRRVAAQLKRRNRPGFEGARPSS